MHSPNCDKVKVWSWLPSLIPLKTTRSMLAVRALNFVSVLSFVIPNRFGDFYGGKALTGFQKRKLLRLLLSAWS